MDLDFFDMNCWIGSPQVGMFLPAFLAAMEARSSTRDEVTPRFDVNHLLALLREVGIGRAIVSHASSLHYDPFIGNQLLLTAIEPYDVLYGSICMIPEHTGEIGDPLRYIKDAYIRKARLVRLFPVSHGFSLAEWSAGRLLEILEELRFPVAIWNTEITWERLHDLCTGYPKLPVIIEGTGKKLSRDNRFFYPLLEQCPNLYIEIHNLTFFLHVDDTVRRFGAERLLFGTYIPVVDPNVGMMLVKHGELDMADKQKIAHGNLEGLLEGILL